MNKVHWITKTVGDERIPDLDKVARIEFTWLYYPTHPLPDADNDTRLALAIAWVQENEENHSVAARYCENAGTHTHETWLWETALHLYNMPVFRLSFVADRLRDIKGSDY